MTSAQSAALAHASPAGAGATTMAVRATDHLFTLIVACPATIGTRLRHAPDARVIDAESVFHALGELATISPESPPTLIVLDSTTARAEAQPLAAAARGIDPHVRILCTGEHASAPGVDGWLAPDAGPDDVLRLASRATDRGSARSVPAGKSTPRAHGVIPELADWSDDEAVMSAVLTARDVLGPGLSRIRKACAPFEVRFIPAASADEPARPAEARVPIQHRGHTFGWLCAPEEARALIEPAANWLALLLAVQEQQATLKTAALTDPLTGAWNRRYFDRFLAGAIDRARRKRNDVSVLLFDIDDFKTYNDRFGHSAGDDILREVVRLLGSVIRPTDRVCRLGGDEFAVIFDAPDGPRDPASRHAASIIEVVRRFQQQIRAHRFPKLGAEAAGRLTVSAGLASFPWDAADPATLLDAADRLLLEAKRQGKSGLTLGPG